MTKQQKYSTACWVDHRKKKKLYSVSLLEMWFPVYIGLMLPFWVNEIPFAQNIMSVCVRTASRLVESLAPVNKKTWTVLKLKMEPQLINYMFYVDFIFCLSQIAATCWYFIVMYGKCSESIFVCFYYLYKARCICQCRCFKHCCLEQHWGKWDK